MSVEIIPVRTRRERARFIRMAWPLYRADPHWVPPIIADQKKFLDPRRGTFFDHGEAQLFLALRGGRPVGRISAHVNHLYDRIRDDGTGFFGFFESEDDPPAAQALFAAAETYLRGKGKRRVEGPLSFGIYEEIGLLVDGFDSDPYVLVSHNLPYYARLVEGAGYRKSIDWYAYRGDTRQSIDERLLRACERVQQKKGFHLRNIDLGRVESEGRIIREIFESAWEHNWGHVPWTEREYRRLVEEVVRIVIPDLSFIAEMDGRPVGFALSIYDANVAVKKINGRLYPLGFLTLLRNLKRTDRFRHILMGVREEHRNQGIEVTFYARIAEKACRLGFREIEMSLIVENNQPMNSSLKHLPVEIYKTYRIYQKPLGSAAGAGT